MVCLLAAPCVQLSVSAGNGWPHVALRHHWLMSISCHFRDCKALLVTSLTHVSGAIASAHTFTFTITIHLSTPKGHRHRVQPRFYQHGPENSHGRFYGGAGGTGPINVCQPQICEIFETIWWRRNSDFHTPSPYWQIRPMGTSPSKRSKL